ncbi:MAG: alpha/beta fold hydrolase [Candidatus Caldatribacteriota bacterium]|nr:alpha/beta fold hydrolase [Candidatus Caldatribacteriota bacterium]
MFKKEEILSLTKLFLRLSIALIFSLGLIISYPNPSILASETINVKDYIKDKFPSVIYNIYLASLDELDQYEKEFIDILQNLPEDTQRYYAKEVYNNGFTQELLEKIREEIIAEKSLAKLEEKASEKLPAVSKEIEELPIRIGKLSLKEKIAYRFIFNEKNTYKYWYNRFLYCGVDLERSRRVISRIKNFYHWCDEWSKEGENLETLAQEALSAGNIYTAKYLFHEASGCFFVGQLPYYIDIRKKNEALERTRENYKRAIELYPEEKRPIRIEIPFRETFIPGYLKLCSHPNRPLIILINSIDSIKEIENHYLGNLLLEAGFNVFAFDGPGQGEMWKNMKMIPDYEKTISTVIDWFEEDNKYNINLKKIATYGISLGGYFSFRAAALDKRICCAVVISGPGYSPSLSELKKVKRALLYTTGLNNLKEIPSLWGEISIKEVPQLDRPLLVIHGEDDKTIPIEHAYCIMDWVIGEKELKSYLEGKHACINFLDEVVPYSIDWLRKHLLE